MSEIGNYHVNRGIGKVDKCRYHLTLAACLIKRTRIPQRKNGAHKLDKVLLPLSVWRGTAAYMLSVSQAKHA